MCDVSDNCLIKSKNIEASCDLSRCICPPRYHPTIDSTDCQPSSGNLKYSLKINPILHIES